MAREYDFSSPLNLSAVSALTGLSGSSGSPLSSGFPVGGMGSGPFDLSEAAKVPIPGIPGVGGGAAGGITSQMGLGMNIPTLQLGFGALNSIGNLYAAFQSNALAKKQFNFTKDAYKQNLTNSIASYNTALADRARSRAVVEGQSPEQQQAYVDQNSLKKI